MLILDQSQRTWAIVSLVLCVLGGGVYLLESLTSLNGPSGGSVPGLLFGILSAGMMVFAGLLGARRRIPSTRIGSAQLWLRAHLWIGGLTVPFALFHAGFRLGGRLEILLWILFFAVILSGLWGLALQQVIPRLMLEQLPRETFVEQIPFLCARFTAESDRMLADMCGPLDLAPSAADLQRYEPHLKPMFEDDRKKNRFAYPKTATEAEHYQIFLAKLYAGIPAPHIDSPSVAAPAASSVAPPAAATPAPKPVLQRAVKPEAASATAPAPAPTPVAATVAPPSDVQLAEVKQFYLDLVRPQLPMQAETSAWYTAISKSTLACRVRQTNLHPQFLEIFNRLEDLCEQREEFARVRWYHRWLHGWLLIHIPATVALYTILAVHIVTALRVVPFGN